MIISNIAFKVLCDNIISTICSNGIVLKISQNSSRYKLI